MPTSQRDLILATVMAVSLVVGCARRGGTDAGLVSQADFGPCTSSRVERSTWIRSNVPELRLSIALPPGTGVVDSAGPVIWRFGFGTLAFRSPSEGDTARVGARGCRLVVGSQEIAVVVDSGHTPSGDGWLMRANGSKPSGTAWAVIAFSRTRAGLDTLGAALETIRLEPTH